MKLSMRQNSLSKNISLSAPVLNFNVTRFSPLKKIAQRKRGFVKEVYQRFGVSYSFEAQNRSTFSDSLLQQNRYDLIKDEFLNGVKQNAQLLTVIPLFRNTWKLTPSVNYSNMINFQQIRKGYDVVNNTTIKDTIQKAGMAHQLSFKAQLNTSVYSYYRFIGKRKTLMRHVLMPTFSFDYSPQLNTSIADSVGVNQEPVTYSPFEQSLYRVTQTKDRALINFGFNNTFELKFKSEKDTLTGFKKKRIIDALSISGNYDLLKDSMQLSNFRVAMRTSPAKWMNHVINATFSPYDWIDSTGKTIKDYALNNGRLGRFLTTSFATTFTFTSKESRKKIHESIEQISQNWNSDFEYFYLHPEYVLNFDIPWKLSLSHVYTITANTNITANSPNKIKSIQTLMINGDLSFTRRWKLSATTNFDFETKKITNARFSLNRNMHCWTLAFHWVPIGGNKSFLFSIRSSSSLFKDAKIDIKRPPVFF